MRMEYCPNCNAITGHQRKLGMGTLIACLMTLGWWVLVIPLYPIRCNKCNT